MTEAEEATGDTMSDDRLGGVYLPQNRQSLICGIYRSCSYSATIYIVITG